MNNKIPTAQQAWQCPEVKKLVEQMLLHPRMDGDADVLTPFLVAQRAEEAEQRKTLPAVTCRHCGMVVQWSAKRLAPDCAEMYAHPGNRCLYANLTMEKRYFTDEV